MTFLKWVPGKKHDGILMTNASQASKNFPGKDFQQAPVL
jgi:hypothetical protein